MARISGVDLPRTKRVEIGLTYIYGIGRHRSKSDPRSGRREPGHSRQGSERRRRAQDQPRASRSRAAVEGDLRKEISMNIKRLIEIGSYRGARHRRNLPVRGQRTRTNARTRKGPRKGAVANKKKATVVRPRMAKAFERMAAKRAKHREGAPSDQKKKTFKKRGEKRVVHHGFVHVQASFNNTMVTITDAGGQRGGVVERRVRSASRARARGRRLPRRRPRSTRPTPPRPSACARARCW